MGPLKGYKIIEFGAVGPVPFAGMLLSDMGAEVLRIDRVSPSGLGIKKDAIYNVTDRGRKSICVDIKSKEGLNVVLDLVSKADALIEGYRPGVMERLGVGPDKVMSLNPRIVYGRMTGMGQSGPMSNIVGHDINYLAMSGALSMLGRKTSPPAVPLNLVADLGGGALYLCIGILAALLEAKESGEGQVVDAAMSDGVTSLLSTYYGLFASGQWTSQRESNFLDGGAPWYNVYETKDNQYVAVGAVEEKFYSNLLKCMGFDKDELPPQYEKESWPKLKNLFEDRFKSKTLAEWELVMSGHDACFSPVLSLDEAASSPHFKARSAVTSVNGVRQPSPAPRFSRTNSEIKSSPPVIGENTIEILESLGLSFSEQAELLKSGAFCAIKA